MTNDNYGSDEVVEEAAVEAVAVAALEGKFRVSLLCRIQQIDDINNRGVAKLIVILLGVFP